MVSVAAVFAVVGYARWTGNLGVVVPGSVYRAGQMGGPTLSKTVGRLGVKTVLNLRGPNPDQRWYRDERAATLAAGATQIDLPMSSCEWLSRAQLRALIRVLDTCERPVLIHCEWGAERTGLASAVSELLRPGATQADAANQFSVRYLFLPVKDGKVMAEHLDAYNAWLAAGRRGHSPGAFRLWAESEYVPLGVSREQWPYNPYPLVVVTRPGPESAPGSRVAGGRAAAGPVR